MSDLSTGVPSAGGRAPDDFADQYNDFSVDDPFAMPLPEAAPTTSRKRPSGTNAISSLGLGIGLDEEIVIAKKPRLIAPKFDESLLLDTTRGIPKLQERAKKLRLKGKGQEFSDVGRMLEMYQIWLNNLYPKNKFLDAAATVERLGHKSRVVVARKGWIDGGRYPKGDGKDVDRVGDGEGHIFADPTLPPREPGGLMQQDAAIFTGTRELAERQKVAGAMADGDAPDDLDLEDLFGTQHHSAPFKTHAPLAAPTAQKSMFGNNDIPSDDDLDALMAEQEMNSAPAPAKPVNRFGKWRANTKPAAGQRLFNEHTPTEPDFAYEDGMPVEDDLDALMAEADMNSQPSKAAPTSIFGPQSSQPVQETQDHETDDLDALLAQPVEEASAKKADLKQAVGEEEEVDYDAMFEETEKLHDTLDKVVEKVKEKENLGVDEDEMAAMDEMGW